MELSFNYFPEFLQYKAMVFWERLKNDHELRYPEGRKRRALELQMDLEKLEQPGIPNTADFFAEFTDAKKTSMFEWHQLFDWAERYEQLWTLIQIKKATEKCAIEAAPHAALYDKIYDRLNDIAFELQSQKLSHDPSLWELVRFRWHCGALRSEAIYLLQRLTL